MRSTRQARTLRNTTALDTSACDAIAQWYTEVSPKLRHWLSARFPTQREHIDDLCQDTFVYVCEHAAQALTIEPKPRVTWLYQIAKNLTIDAVKRGGQWNGNTVHLGVFNQPGSLVTIDCSAAAAQWLVPHNADSDPERVHIARESLAHALSLIPEDSRAIVAAVLLGYTSIEVAAYFSLTESAVRMRVSRARRIWAAEAERLAA